MSQYLPNIRDAVKGGLGFVMLGGEESFGAGGYAGTAIEEIVPLAPVTAAAARCKPKCVPEADARRPRATR